MRLTVLLLSMSIFLTSAHLVMAGDSSVNVQINNSLNTKNTTSYSSETKTKIDIEQSGNGTSEVKVNGKEYKVEGPGELHINENVTDTPSPTQPPTTPTPVSTPTSSPSPTEVSTGSPTPTEISLPSLSEIIENRMEELKKTFQEIFDQIFNLN